LDNLICKSITLIKKQIIKFVQKIKIKK
jgi:hypothetical protein